VLCLAETGCFRGSTQACRKLTFYVDSPSVAGSDGVGIAWLLRSEGGGLEFVVATRFGLRRVETFGELLVALDAIGAPTNFPLSDWPGVTVTSIA